MQIIQSHFYHKDVSLIKAFVEKF